MVNDLKDWWEYCWYRELDWRSITQRDIEDYVVILRRTISPKKHEPYSSRTVKRQLSTIMSFYTWAKRQGWTEVTFDSNPVKPRSAVDETYLSYTSSQVGKVQNSSVPSNSSGVTDNMVRPLSPIQVRQVFNALGPLPPTISMYEEDTRPTRDRLIADLSLNTGLRREEIAQLKRWQVDHMLFESTKKSDYESIRLDLEVTKGMLVYVINPKPRSEFKRKREAISVNSRRKFTAVEKQFSAVE